MNHPDDQEIRDRLSHLAEVRPNAETTHRAVERARGMIVSLAPAASRTRQRRLTRRLAAAAVVMLGGLAIAMWLLRGVSSAQAAFADVQAAMKRTCSVTCRQVTRVRGKPSETVRMLILGEGLWRAEESDGSYAIMDTVRSRALLVQPSKREATLLQGANLPRVNLYELIKNLPRDASARSLPAKKVGGRWARGFIVKVHGHDLTVWADTKTLLPMRIEGEERDAQGMAAEVVIDEFAFDRGLEPALFAFETPTGYKLEKQGTAELPPAPAAAERRDLLVKPLVGIGPVKFGMSREEVIRQLGPADAVQEEGKRGFVNLNYGSRGMFLGVSKTLGVVTVTCVTQEVMATRVRNFSGKTDKGLALGAGAAEIIRIYGLPDTKRLNKTSTYLSYNRLQAQLTLFDDRLVQMTFSRPRGQK